MTKNRISLLAASKKRTSPSKIDSTLGQDGKRQLWENNKETSNYSYFNTWLNVFSATTGKKR